MSDWHLRTAVPTDDLQKLWPTLGAMKLELSQVVVAVDPDDDDRLLAGAIMFHSGHEIAYVGELTIVQGLPDGLRRAIGKKLVEDVLTWCQRRAVIVIVFNVQDPAFAAMAQRLGATLVGHSMLLTMRVTPYEEQHYGGGLSQG